MSGFLSGMAIVWWQPRFAVSSMRRPTESRRWKPAVAILEQREELVGGELRVGLGNSMPGMALISSFKGLYPKIQIRVEIGNWSDIVAAVIDRRVARCRTPRGAAGSPISIRSLSEPAGRCDLPSRASPESEPGVDIRVDAIPSRISHRQFLNPARRRQGVPRSRIAAGARDRRQYKGRHAGGGGEPTRRRVHLGARLKPHRPDRESCGVGNGR